MPARVRLERALFIVSVLLAGHRAKERAAGGTAVVQAAVERTGAWAAAMAPPVTFKTGVVSTGAAGQREEASCTIAPPLTVSWAYQVLLPVTVGCRRWPACRPRRRWRGSRCC